MPSNVSSRPVRPDRPIRLCRSSKVSFKRNSIRYDDAGAAEPQPEAVLPATPSNYLYMQKIVGGIFSHALWLG
jgi:hypothetical protein